MLQVKLWTERKELETKLNRSAEKQRKLLELELEEEKKQQIEKKAEAKYQEWLEQKKVEDLKKKNEEQLKKKEEEQKKQERDEKCKKAFEEWKKKALKRPRSVPNSFGYANGKLTGKVYHAFLYQSHILNVLVWILHKLLHLDQGEKS